MGKKSWIGLGVLCFGAGFVHFLLPGIIEDGLNRTQPHEPYRVSEEAKALHASIPVADLHSDALLWKRDLGRQSRHGHVDLPRLREGGVVVQVFSSVTQSPRGQNYDANAGDSDRLTGLVIAQIWPPRTWTSFLQRALHQAGKLKRLEERKPGQIRFVRSRADLQEVIDAREAGGEMIGAIFGTEGGHALEGDPANLDLLYEAGLRVLGLTHFIDNDLGGSLHGVSAGGLTEVGAAVIEAANEKNIVIDVAHASVRVVRDVLSLSRSPIILSHGGLKGTCGTPRNLEDDLAMEIASHGGLIGVGFWDAAVCDITPEGVVRSIRYAIDLLGEDHVALGSDYDGTTEVAFDSSELSVLTQLMMDQGFTEEEIRKVMGENAVNFFLENLPG
jgi:microsomal dipeptidase-like Zn-dependent dipeptidase